MQLGRYVIARPKRGGTHQVFFAVPARLRPEDWPATIPLPLAGKRTGNLEDQIQVRAIVADARLLNHKLDRARAGVSVTDQERTLPVLAAIYQRSERYKALKPITAKAYGYHLRHVLRWSSALGDPDPSHLTQPEIEAFLSAYDDRPLLKAAIRNMINLLMQQAITVGWRSDNPSLNFRMKIPDPKINLWNVDDVHACAAACLSCGEPGLAGIIRTMWETGSRLGDVRLFRFDEHYETQEFRYWSSKTNSFIYVPVSCDLADYIEGLRGGGEDYIFLSTKSGRPFGIDDVSIRFRKILKATGTDRGRRLLLKCLRHSAVVDLARADVDLPQIASVTGHAMPTLHRIASRYLTRDSILASNAQTKRGLISPKPQSTPSDLYDSESHDRDTENETRRKAVRFRHLKDRRRLGQPSPTHDS